MHYYGANSYRNKNIEICTNAIFDVVKENCLNMYWYRCFHDNSDVVRSFHNDLRGILSHRQLRQAWYQQDGAPPHTAHGTIRYLKELFPGRLIALKSDVEWAPHSPDLNPLDFWLWGAAKDEVYKARPRTLEALKRQVTEYVQQVPLATCRKVGDNFKVRVAACRRRRGGHIEHISYHKLAGF